MQEPCQKLTMYKSNMAQKYVKILFYSLMDVHVLTTSALWFYIFVNIIKIEYNKKWDPAQVAAVDHDSRQDAHTQTNHNPTNF